MMNKGGESAYDNTTFLTWRKNAGWNPYGTYRISLRPKDTTDLSFLGWTPYLYYSEVKVGSSSTVNEGYAPMIWTWERGCYEGLGYQVTTSSTSQYISEYVVWKQHPPIIGKYGMISHYATEVYDSKNNNEVNVGSYTGWKLVYRPNNVYNFYGDLAQEDYACYIHYDSGWNGYSDFGKDLTYGAAAMLAILSDLTFSGTSMESSDGTIIARLLQHWPNQAKLPIETLDYFNK